LNSDNKCDFACGYEFENSIEQPEEDLNLIQKIAQWFKNIFNSLFGWLKF
jgi:hypothetical protein